MKKIVIIITAICAFNSNIYAQRTVKGNGVIKTEKRQTVTYDQITLIGSTDIELVSGKEGNLSITGDANLIDYIETTVVNNELLIKFKDKQNYNATKGIKVTVPVQDISKITLKGSGNINSTNTLNDKNLTVSLRGSGDVTLLLNCENVFAEVLGSGDMKLSGKTKSLKANLKGSGDLKAKTLKAENCDLEVRGSGDLDAYASSKVTASLFGSGDIDVIGSPKEIKKDKKGSGSINIR